MAATWDVQLPTDEELTVPEVKLSAVPLRAAAFHLGKYCEGINNEFMLCRNELEDPRKCLNEGKAVTSCSLEFFRKLKKHCNEEFTAYYNCIDRSSADYKFSPCRKTQNAYDQCVLENLNLERPEYGYFCRVRVHKTDRPKVIEEPDVYEVPPGLPEDYEKYDAKYGSRYPFFP
ncbi:NADH dehydrogenase [ubiquinone] 1 alpha subcomplex subunit 8 [Lycorma delicatula]|uniref:NADH dehydrogenase [ubiquinone] 1 alpha subcomplex subunit 8 n=1 Tax=Lycorma delicatula TaxID=130591 RepID=UPI003F51250B